MEFQDSSYLSSPDTHTRAQEPLTHRHLTHAHSPGRASITRALDQKQLFREWNPGGCEQSESESERARSTWKWMKTRPSPHSLSPTRLREMCPLRAAHLPSIALFCTRSRSRSSRLRRRQRRRAGRAFKLTTWRKSNQKIDNIRRVQITSSPAQNIWNIRQPRELNSQSPQIFTQTLQDFPCSFPKNINNSSSY